MSDIVERLDRWRIDQAEHMFDEESGMLSLAADEIRSLRHDIGRHIAIATEQAQEIEELRGMIQMLFTIHTMSDEQLEELKARCRTVIKERDGG